MTPNWIGYAATGRELAVEAAICALGINARVPVQVIAKRKGKQRHPEPEIVPALPNYVLIQADPEQWHRLRTVKHLRPTMLSVSPGAAVHLRAWINRASEDYAARMAQIEAGQRLSEYNPGEVLKITAGPFAGLMAQFARLVERTGDIPMIEAEANGLRFRVDPLHAKRA